MTPIDPSVGEFRVHYAGVFDPGFGTDEAHGKGSRGVLEVRSHETPFILEDGQTVARLVYEPLTEKPDRLYGDLGSHYQRQGLKLSKHFHEALKVTWRSEGLALAQVLKLSFHLELGIDHHRHIGKGALKNALHGQGLGLQLQALVPRPSVEGQELKCQDTQYTPFGPLVFLGPPKHPPTLLGGLPPTPTTSLGPLALGKIPFTEAGHEQSLGLGLHLGRESQEFAGLRDAFWGCDDVSILGV